MLAYWHIQHTHDEARPLLSSRPATYADLVSTVLLSRGVKPGGTGRVAKRKATPVRVVGGKLTPEIEMVAEQWKRQTMPKHMARRTGSTTEAVAWLFDPER